MKAGMSRITDRLDELEKLEEDWDSYGAAKPDPMAIERARVFVREILEGDPHVIATVNGEIAFEGNGGTSIEIGPEDTGEIFIDLESR